MTRILIVEDDPDIVHVAKAYLEKDGFQVDVARDGLIGFEKATQFPPNLIVLDWMLPGLDGITFLHRLRKEHKTPVIMLTARTEEVDRLKGLALADDYITKPFSPKELVARVKAVLRRFDSSDTTPVVITHGNLTIDPARRVALRGSVPLELTVLEFDLLYTFAKSPGRVFRRDELLERVWGRDYDGVDRVVDVHVSNLRQKLEPDPDHPSYLLTIRGIGYKLTTAQGGSRESLTTP
jgi:two-component system, OmpR family, alkaline phosphatase synthesis response regulator PhoP